MSMIDIRIRYNILQCTIERTNYSRSSLQKQVELRGVWVQLSGKEQKRSYLS